MAQDLPQRTKRRLKKAACKSTRRKVVGETKPEVGIFWIFEGEMLKVSIRMEKGVRSGDAIDSPFNHVDEWPKLRSGRAQLQDYEYEQIPRGRVLYKADSKFFCAYADKVLQSPKYRKMIRDAFHLPARRTKFITDAHYTTTAADLERLFTSQ